MIVCQIDGTTHESIESLYGHLKMLRVGRERYWHEHLPRRDKLTGELIPFKDYEQYTTQDFANKINLRNWLKVVPRAEGLEWSTKWLRDRKEKKGLVYAPSQVELRTLCCPSMPYYETMAAQEGGYYGVTANLGFTSRYRRESLVFAPLPKDATVIQDSREQNPVALGVKTVVDTVNVGDYALVAPHDKGIRIERKSLADFCGTLSAKKAAKTGGSLGRFDRELARAVAKNLYVVMMVESNINDAQRFDYLPQTKWVKATPAYVFRNLRDLLVKYPLHFQVVFVDGRKDMAAKMVRVFELGEQVKSIDLQFAQEEGLL